MNLTAESVWGKCLMFIKDNLDNHNFKTWFEPIVPVKLNGNALTIQVPSKFFYEWLETHYIKLLRVSLVKELGNKANLIYDVKMANSLSKKMPQVNTYPSSNRKPFQEQRTVAPLSEKRELKNPFIIPGVEKDRIKSYLNPNNNFNNYVEGVSNRLARSAGMAVAARPGGTSFNPLLLYGGVGLGKTHLANAIGVEIKDKFPDKTILYITADKFCQQFIESVKSNSRNDFVHYYQAIDVLVVDDVQLLSGKPKTQDVFFHIFNHLHQNGKQVILTSDKAPVNMQDIEQRLLSRFKWGLSAEIATPDYETRISILKVKLFRDGVEMPNDIIGYLAKHVKSSVRDLEGVVNSMIAHAAYDKKDFTLSLAREVVEKSVKTIKKEISIDYIKKIVSNYFDMDVETLQSKTRKRNIVQARQIAMYFSKKLTKSSLANIGKEIGQRDHATVLHACKTVNNLVTTDKTFKKYVDDLLKKLTY